jgi:integrase
VHGLRKLAAAALADAGCTAHEIAAVTGHRSLAMVSLYTASADQERLAEAAIVRFSAGSGQTAKRTIKHKD